MNPVSAKIYVPNGVWTLYLAPTNGWSDPSLIMIGCILGLFFCVTVTLLAYSILSLIHQRKVLKQLAVTDTLTGLYNRRMLQTIVEDKVKRSEAFLLCYLDLNDFKQINDNFGHDFGDLFLKETAVRVKDCLKKGEFLFRIGGDEFVAILFNDQVIPNYEERIRIIEDKMKEKFMIDKEEVLSSLSIGCSRYPEDGNNCEQLLKIADQHMYSNKAERKIEENS